MAIAGLALLVLALALAIQIARRRVEHRPIAAALAIALLADLARAALVYYFPINPDPTATPHVGLERVVVLADRALFILWPFALSAAAVRVLARRAAWPIAAAYAAACGVLVLGYPALRFGALRRAYLAIDLVALLPAVASVATWYARGVRRGMREATAGAAPSSPDYSGRVIAILVAGQLFTVAFGPYRFGLFGDAWEIVAASYVLILAAVVVVQLIEVSHAPR